MDFLHSFAPDKGCSNEICIFRILWIMWETSSDAPTRRRMFIFYLLPMIAISEKDQDLLTNLMLEFSKDKGFPFFEKVLDASPMNRTIFSSLPKEQYYSSLIPGYISKRISSASGTKMGKLLRE